MSEKVTPTDLKKNLNMNRIKLCEDQLFQYSTECIRMVQISTDVLQILRPEE